MNILWITNVKLPIIFRLQENANVVNVGGWLDRISQGLIVDKSLQLTACYPFSISEEGSMDNLNYVGIPYNGKRMRLGSLDDSDGVRQAIAILEKYKPDVIHIHGSEFQFHWFFAKAAEELGLKNRLVVSIQGMVSIYARHYALGIPEQVKKAFTLKELISKSNISYGIKNFVKRGSYEEETIKTTHHIMGRTSWDRACTYRLNPNAIYHFVNETLRESFYTEVWDKETMVPHRIFISQASYPVKGFHLFIDALIDIYRFYPDVTVHVAGADLSKSNRENRSTYAAYVMKLLKKNGLTHVVKFCGSLTEQQMKEEMLQANVFVSSSTIENSPNSVGEAMILGVPVISSGVGGVMDLLKHGEEGFIYQSDAPYMLAYYVMKIFSDSVLAQKLGVNARNRAISTHDYDKNLKKLIEVYTMIKEG